MKQFQKLLLPLQRKLFLEKWVYWLLVCGVVGTGLGIIYAVVSKFQYIMDKDLFWIAVLGLIVVVSLVLAVWQKPTLEEAAKVGDSLGYAERFVTTWELLQCEKTLTSMEQLAVADGIEQATQHPLAKAYSLQISKKLVKLLVVLVLVLCSTGFLGTVEQEEAEQYGMAQLKKIEQVGKEVEKQKNLEQEVKENFKEELKQVEKDIKKAQTVEEGQKAVQQAQQAIKALEKEAVPKDLKTLAEQLGKTEQGAQLASSLQRGNSQEIAGNMTEILSALEQMPPEERQQLAEVLQQMSNLQNPALQQQLQTLGQKIGANDIAGALSQGKTVEELLSELAKNGEALQAEIENWNKALGEQTTGQQGTSGTGETGGEGEGSSGASGDGGTGNGGTSTGSGGAGRGQGHSETEHIYTRKAQNMGETEIQLQGEQNREGQTIQTQETTMGNRGESIPYGQVYHAYQNEALEALENSSVPYGMRNLVSEYFSTLEQ